MKLLARFRRDEFHELREREKHKARLDRHMQSWGEREDVPDPDVDAGSPPNRWFGFLRTKHPQA